MELGLMIMIVIVILIVVIVSNVYTLVNLPISTAASPTIGSTSAYLSYLGGFAAGILGLILLGLSRGELSKHSFLFYACGAVCMTVALSSFLGGAIYHMWNDMSSPNQISSFSSIQPRLWWASAVIIAAGVLAAVTLFILRRRISQVIPGGSAKPGGYYGVSPASTTQGPSMVRRATNAATRYHE